MRRLRFFEKARQRVVRLCEGRQKANDLDEIFLWLRSRPFGQSIVRDIGDFVAHPEERNQGQAWAHIRRICDCLRFGVALNDPERQVSRDVFVGHVEAALNLVPKDQFKSSINIGHKKAAKIARDVIPSLVGFSDGRPVANRPVTGGENRVLHFLASKLTISAAYTRDEIAGALSFVLEKNSLFPTAVSSLPDHSVDAIMIYLITKLHGAHMAYRDGANVNLYGSRRDSDGMLLVYATSEYPWRAKGKMTVDFIVLETGLSVGDYCSERLFQLDTKQWQNYELEVGESGLLDVVL